MHASAQRLALAASLSLLLAACGGGGGTTPTPTPTPPAAPAAPGAVTATPGNAQVTLSWGAVTGATSYNVYWSTTAGVTKASGTKVAGVTSASYLHASLTNGTTYHYVVTAVSAGGESAASPPASAVPATNPAPAAPTGLGAAAGNAQVTLTWPAVTGATSYTLYWSTSAGVTKANGTAITGVTTGHVHGGLTNGTTYHYVLTASNANGESVDSAPASATPAAPPAAPTGLVATAGDAQITLTWPSVAGATSYNLYRATSAGVTKGTGTKFANVTSGVVQSGLTNGTTYYYVLTAVNAAGESGDSSEASARPLPPPPAAPTGVAAAAGNAQVTISWGNVTGASSYNLYWSTTTGVTKGTGTKVTGASNPYVHSGLANGTPYYYVVTAVGLGGESADSSQETATPVAPPPAPANVQAAAGNAQVSVSWNAVAGATRYNVYRKAGSAPTTSVYDSKTPNVSASPLVVSSLTNGTTYHFIVTAENAGGESPASTSASATPLPPVPAAPTVTATAGDGQVTLSWANVSGATTYNVYWSTTSGFAKADGTKLSPVTSPYVHTGLANGTPYYYLVTAENLGGESAPSAQKTATPSPAAGYSIQGTVTGPAVEGVRVSLSTGAFVDVGPAGTYAFPGLAAGTYTLSAALPGYTFPGTGSVTISTASVTRNLTQTSVETSYRVSGSLSYTGSKASGRAYVWVMDPAWCNEPHCAAAGTSVALVSGGSASYEVRGVRPGTYKVVAALDYSGYGVPNATRPRAQTASFTVSGDVVKDLTLTDPVGQTPVAPDGISAFPGPNGAFVLWDAPWNGLGEVASDYVLSWGTDAAATNGGSATVPAYDNPYKLVSGLTNGQAYYFKVKARVGTTESAAATTGPVTIGAAAGGNTISGTVTGATSTSGALFVLLHRSTAGGDEVRFTRVASPSASQAYSITGVGAGTWTLMAVHDANGDGWAYGEPGKDQPLTVSGSATVNLALSSAAFAATLQTQHTKDLTDNNEWYNLVFRVEDEAKTPVQATILSGNGLPLPLDLPRDWNFEKWTWVPTTPVAGDQYRLKVTYADGTSDTQTLTITGVLGAAAFAQNLSEQTTAPGSPAAPLFKWAAPSSPPSPYGYRVSVWGNGEDWWYPDGEDTSIPSGTTSALWDIDGGASTTALPSGTYTWAVIVVDANGNMAQAQKQFTVVDAGDPVAFASAIQGEWYTPCEFDVSTYVRGRITISGTGFTVDMLDFGMSDSSCSGTPTATRADQGTWAIGSAVSAPFAFETVTAYQLDVASDTEPPFYDLAYIDANGVLYFGATDATHDRSTALKRPVAIDPYWPYVQNPGGSGPPPAVDFSTAILGTWTTCDTDGVEDWAFTIVFATGGASSYAEYSHTTNDGTCGGTGTLAFSDTATYSLGAGVATTIGTGGASIAAQQLDFLFGDGSRSYELVYIDTSATPDRLHFGDETTGDGTSALTRPTVIGPGYLTK